ncbi:MAG: hypothetical protein ABS54_11565 [Hyphomicrobium sp. SCN 65-11]|nr:MAG: hypothetical protein ABS54_11565 [Hyphomicrobium sp. SCN 65-11]
MRQQTFNHVVGLGQICRAKYNIERKWTEHRRTGWRATTDSLTRTVFDWQATPYPALLEYFRRDFQGMFELEDLGMLDGRVVNERYGTLHRHDFPDNPDLALHYAAARSRHDHLCRKTRNAITAPLPTLFIRYGALAPAEERTLHDAIAALRRDQPFALALIDDDGHPPSDPDEPWQGNHDYWDRALSRYSVRSGAPLSRILAKMAREQVLRIAGHIRHLRF